MEKLHRHCCNKSVLQQWWIYGRTRLTHGPSHCNCFGSFYLPPATKLGQGYVFTGVCDSVHKGGCVCLSACWDATPSREAGYWLKSPEISNCTKRKTRRSFKTRQIGGGSGQTRVKTSFAAVITLTSHNTLQKIHRYCSLSVYLSQISLINSSTYS